MPLTVHVLRAGLALFTTVGLGACRVEVQEPARQLPPTSSTPGRDSSVAPADAPVTGAPAPVAPQVSQAVVDTTVQAFLDAVVTGNRKEFDRMLSSRSQRFIDDVDASREVFGTAREALGGLRGVKSTIIGGDADSVALLLRGQPTRLGDTTDRELIVILLKEAGEWKVMYPGLQRPGADFRR